MVFGRVWQIAVCNMGIFDNNIDDEELNKSFQDAQESLNTLLSSTGGIAKYYGKELTQGSRDIYESLRNDLAPNFNEWQEQNCGNRWKFQGFGRHRRRGANEYGMWAYPVPTVKAFDKCTAKEGVSVWDKEGVWRCLFPQYSLPDDGKGVSKEDYLTNKNGIKDSLFENYNDLLGWKSKMKKLQAEEFQKAFDNRKLVKGGDEVQEIQNPSNVIGTSTIDRTQTNEDGSVENYSKVLKWYQDGSSLQEETRKIVPNDGSEPKVERNVENHGPNDKPGWFWN